MEGRPMSSQTTLALTDADARAGAPDGSTALAPEQSLFQMPKQRNAATGALSGISAFAKGVVVGAVGLVAAPVAGAREGGVRGALQGAGIGVAGAVILPVAGAVIGLTQLARGVLATPDAIAQRSKGKIWDEELGEWIVYDLQDEARALLSETEEEWCVYNHIHRTVTVSLRNSVGWQVRGSRWKRGPRSSSRFLGCSPATIPLSTSPEVVRVGM